MLGGKLFAIAESAGHRACIAAKITPGTNIHPGITHHKYLRRLQQGGGKQTRPGGGFGDKAMAAMFIGMVSAYIGSYVGGWISGGGLFTFSGSWTPLAVVLVAAVAMAVFTYFSEKKGMAWLDNFSIAGSMLIGMLAAVLIGH